VALRRKLGSNLAVIIPFVFVILTLVVTSCATAATPTPTTKATAPSTAAPKSSSSIGSSDLLVETDQLAQLLSDSNIRIVDARAANDFKAGHIKGAVNIPVDTAYGTAGNAGTVPTAEQVAELFGSKGIGNEQRVILYDAGKQYNAVRLLWTLEYYGHKKVSLLNGGFKKWQKENKEVSTAEPTIVAAKLAAKADPTRVATMDDMSKAVGRTGVAFVDARAPAEYTGADARAKRGGHVPGAVNIDWVELFNADDTIKSTADLAKIYSDKAVTKDKEVYAYCQVGMRSAMSYYTLRLLGYEKVRHYVASWQEWGNEASTAIEK
jgi:thiosulfate/3-mercaptopyruvate sulfurtransferase